MAATLERIAELVEKRGYTKWADKWRKDAALFREDGGPERFAQEAETQQVVTQSPTSETPILVNKTTEGVTQELERIAAQYQDMEVHKHTFLTVSAGRLKDIIMDLVAPQPEAFKGRFDIPVIVFGQIPPEDQARLAGVDYYLQRGILWQRALNVRDWEKDPRAYRTPTKAYMTWMQSGRQNLNLNVEEVRSTLRLDERGATVHDGIGLYVARPHILSGHYVDLPGTSVGSHSAAYLRLSDARPGLDCRSVGDELTWFGSASCGRNYS